MTAPGADPSKFLDPGTWDMATGMRRQKQLVSGRVLADIATYDERVCVLHSDSALPTRTDDFGTAHPERFINFGIAERNMLSAAAGLASVGFIPYVAGYASFLSLMCVEQIRTDISYPGYPVRILASNSGVATGSYGTTHHATEDVGSLASIAGLTILSPIDGSSLEYALKNTVDVDGPIYFRLGNGLEPSVYGSVPETWGPGSSVEVRTGDAAALLATGIGVSMSLEAATLLAQDGIECSVIDMCSLKPLDVERVREAAGTGLIVTIEDHNVVGGLASQVADRIALDGLDARLVAVGLPDSFAPAKERTAVYELFGMDPIGIAKQVKRGLDQA